MSSDIKTDVVTTQQEETSPEQNSSNRRENQVEMSSTIKEANDFRYHRFGGRKRDPQFTPQQFKEKAAPIPIKQILIALVMFIAGTAMIVVGALLFTGVIDTKYSDRTWPVFIIGAILFLPGFYHVRLAYYAWYEYEGFSFEDIPNDD